MKDNLEELNSFKASILDNAGFAIVSVDPQGIITLFNRAAEEMLGYTAEEVVGKQSPALFHLEEEIVEKAEAFSTALGIDIEPGFEVFVIKSRMGLKNKHEWTCVRKNGSRFPALLSVTAIHEQHKAITGYLGVVADITDLKTAQQQALTSSEKLNEAQKLAKVGSWELDLNSDSLWWSDETFRLFEIDPNQFEASYEAFLAAIHPEDRDKVNEAYTNSLQTRQPYEITHRLLFSDGHVKYVHEACETLYDSAGKPVLSRGTVQDVTEKKLAEEKLQESQQRFRDITYNSNDWIWEVDAQGKYTFVSDAVSNFLGYSPQEILGKTPFELMPAEEAQRVAKIFQDLAAEKKSFKRLQNINLHRDGHEVVLETSGVPIMDKEGRLIGYRGTDTDITEHKKFTERLENTVESRTLELLYDKARFTAVIDTAADGIIITDTRGIITQYNQSAARIFGYSKDEVMGQNVTVLMPDAYAKTHDGFVTRHLENQEKGVMGTGRELQGRRKDGSVIPIYIALSRIDINNQCSGFTAIIHDLSIEKQKAFELTQAKEAAEQANQAKSQFLAIMSHEIRTPMNAILGYSELELINKALPEKSLQNLKKIHDSSRFLLDIINDILDLSKLESEKVKLENIPFELTGFIRNTLTVFEQQITAKGLAFNIDLAADLPHCVTGDPTRLRQVITNLMSNAIKFTEQGQINFECKKHTSPDTLQFSIRDTGIGLSTEQIEKIFDSFAQADTSTTRIYGGTGLGTSISKRLVEAMGGEIWVESEPETGSIFHFTCHLSLVDECQENVLPEKDTHIDNVVKAQEMSKPGSCDILLVEDNQFNQELIQQQLEVCGYSADISDHGADALNKIEKGNYRLVISDISMPVMDGYELIQQIRNREKGTQRHLKVMAMTANAMQGEEKKCLEMGFDDYCTKPLKIDVLREKLEKLL